MPKRGKTREMSKRRKTREMPKRGKTREMLKRGKTREMSKRGKTLFPSSDEEGWREAPGWSASVAPRGSGMRRSGFPTQRCRRKDFNLGAVAQNVADQFTIVAVGKFEHIRAVAFELRTLLRVPFLRRDPARALRREAQFRPRLRLPGKNSVALGERVVEFRRADFFRCRIEHGCMPDAVDREAADSLTRVAPRVEIPVLP